MMSPMKSNHQSQHRHSPKELIFVPSNRQYSVDGTNDDQHHQYHHNLILQVSSKTTTPTTPIRISVRELEYGLTRRLKVDGDFDELEYIPRHDVHFLKCQQAPAHTIQTILGIIEDRTYNNSRCRTTKGTNDENDDDDDNLDNNHDGAVTSTHQHEESIVNIVCYVPVSMADIRTSDQWDLSHSMEDTLYRVRGSHSEWIRSSDSIGNDEYRRYPISTTSSNDNNINDDDDTDDIVENDVTTLWWVDLTRIPQADDVENKKNDDDADDDDDDALSFLNTQSGVVRFFRSLLSTSHEASPWVTTTTTKSRDWDEDHSNPIDDEYEYEYDDVKSPSCLPDIVVVAMKSVPPVLRDFRVGDVSPSWFLHGIAQLDDLEPSYDLFQHYDDDDDNDDDDQTTNRGRVSPPRYHDDDESVSPATILIYKKLARRPYLTRMDPIGTTSETIEGCLWETYRNKDEEDENIVHEDGCDSNEEGIHTKQRRDDDGCHSLSVSRQLSPPYLNLEAEYPNTTLGRLFSPEAIQIFTQDALSIPQWTPWPETAHYKVRRTISGDVDDDDVDGSAPGGVPWTVFPLCHCFPANQPQNLTWVEPTKVHVPRTCRLLEELVGIKYLRTALFSRLAPHSVLEAHTGWADLANHVLRLHIPLVVPCGEEDLCGTWVDGCIETHSVGRPLLFDDSKIHRAFNYSDGSRLVLIVDLARPEHLPAGSASGGHSEELDAFIAQMKIPK